MLTISNCAIYNSANNFTSCSQCSSGSTLINGRCATLPTRCLVLNNSTGFCSSCSTGYTPIVQNNQSICIFPVGNCSIYDTAGRCIQCQPNFVLQSNKCNFFIEGCLNLNNNTCIQCTVGYNLTRDGYCIRDPNCNVSSAGVCLACISGYRLVNGTCTKNDITNCDIQIGVNCTQCSSGYVLILFNNVYYCLQRQIAYSGCRT